MTLGERIVIMKDGFIQQIGTPQEVFDQPANLFVAGFILSLIHIYGLRTICSTENGVYMGTANPFYGTQL